jgi:hypothetical protein
MKKLLKAYGFNSDIQYFEMIVESVINGQRTQAKEQFKAMSKENRKGFLTSLVGGNWESGLSDADKTIFL